MDGSTPQHVPKQPDDNSRRHRGLRSNWWYLLVLLPLIGLLYPPFYSRIHPMLGGVPFFVWYQFAWVPAAVVITVIMSRMTD